MIREMRLFSVGLAVVAGTSFGSPVQANLKGNLIIEVNGLRNQRGLLCFKVFANAKDFPSGGGPGQCLKIQQTPLTVTISELSSGSYAIAVFHDQNGDRQLNRNGLGIPLEGYGFSRNPVVRTGPPRFGDAAVVLAGANTRVKIQMQYGGS
jgi:uncharacterized protein (DUF2141 family)